MDRLAYRVTAPDNNGARHGTETTLLTPRKLADRLADETRALRPDMTGTLTIHVWAHRGGWHYRGPVPDDAERFDYPAH